MFLISKQHVQHIVEKRVQKYTTLTQAKTKTHSYSICPEAWNGSIKGYMTSVFVCFKWTANNFDLNCVVWWANHSSSGNDHKAVEALVKGPILAHSTPMTPRLPRCHHCAPGAAPSIDKECADAMSDFFNVSFFCLCSWAGTCQYTKHWQQNTNKQTMPLLLYHCAHAAGIVLSISIVQHIGYFYWSSAVKQKLVRPQTSCHLKFYANSAALKVKKWIWQ